MSPKSGEMKPLKKNQQGFLIPLSIFIIVVMGLFALVLSRNTIQTSTATAQEIVSTQAFYTAETGAQLGMQNLFFPDANVRQQVDARCVALIATPITRTFTSGGANDVPGLNGCTATVTCKCVDQNNNGCNPATAANYSSTAPASALVSYYTITSVANCGSKNLRAVRTIDVGSFLKQE